MDNYGKEEQICENKVWQFTIFSIVNISMRIVCEPNCKWL